MLPTCNKESVVCCTAGKQILSSLAAGEESMLAARQQGRTGFAKNIESAAPRPIGAFLYPVVHSMAVAVTIVTCNALNIVTIRHTHNYQLFVNVCVCVLRVSVCSHIKLRLICNK